MLAVVLIVGPSAEVAIGQDLLREVGAEAGLDTEVFSFGVAPHDYDDDGWVDLLLMHHAGPAQVMHNERGAGFEVVATLRDTIHERNDRHGCAWGDVNQDDLDDIYCTKGAHKGTQEKWNELWIQGPAGVFTDQAAAFGVEDHWGRGRLAAFLDINHDAYPDLFVGNEYPRADGRWTPNRTFVNVSGKRFEETRMGITRELGAECVQVVDVDGDGDDDMIVCGHDELFVFLRRGGQFVQRAEELGVSTDRARGVLVARLNGDDRLDIVIVRKHQVTIQRGNPDGTFGEPLEHWHLFEGTSVAVGDVDGVNGADVLVVQGCLDDGVNLADALLVNRGGGNGWDRVRIGGRVAGCGDASASLDFDRDRMDDFIVMNGRPLKFGKGPDQLWTAGDWTAPTG
jgi:hypothetical protein